MKTILDKIDPRYIECTTGICEHVSHKANIIMWVLLTVAVTVLYSKYRHGTNT